jgi:hypothetical protein
VGEGGKIAMTQAEFDAIVEKASIARLEAFEEADEIYAETVSAAREMREKGEK